MKKLLHLFCLLCCIGLQAQKKSQDLLDSMMKLLPLMKEDSSKVNLIVDMSEQLYYLANMKEGIDYLKQGVAIAERINFKRGIANCYSNLGTFVGDTGNIVQARAYIKKSLEINTELDAKPNIVINLNNMGRGYQFESDFPNAVSCLFKALKIAEEIKSYEKMALVGTNLTATFIMQKNYAKAEEYAKMTFKNAELGKAPYHAASSLQQLGVIYADKNDTVGSIDYFNKAMEIYRREGMSEGELECMSEISNLENPEAGLRRKLEIQAILDKQVALIPVKIGNLGSIGSYYSDLAGLKAGALKRSYLIKATHYLRRALDLARDAKYADQVASMAKLLGEVEKEKGNFKEALALNTEYHGINDSIFSQDKKNTIASLESQKTVDLKDKEIQINKLAISNQHKTQIVLISGLGFLLVVGGLLYWQSRNRKKTNTTLMVLNNQLDEANKVKARFFSILSHDLRSPIVNLVHFLHLQKESPQLLSEQQQAKHRQSISDSAEGLLNTMEAMLLWSKEQMENFRPNIKHVPVSSLFEYLQKQFSYADNVNLSFEGSPDLLVATDENYLRTIMQNLTSNAIRALNKTPHASIAWKAVNEAGNIILSITDNGPGISAIQSKSLFDESVTSNEKNGLGLHLVRDLAKAIRFKIAVQSAPGMGTTFTLSALAAA